MLNLFICSEELARGGDTLCSAPFYLFFGCFFFFFLIFSVEVLKYFILHRLYINSVRGGEDIQAYWHFYVWHSLCLSGGWWWCWWGKENQTPRLFQWTALILNLTHLHLLTYLHCSLIPTVKFVVWIGGATHARFAFPSCYSWSHWVMVDRECLIAHKDTANNVHIVHPHHLNISRITAVWSSL